MISNSASAYTRLYCDLYTVYIVKMIKEFHHIYLELVLLSEQFGIFKKKI